MRRHMKLTGGTGSIGEEEEAGQKTTGAQHSFSVGYPRVSEKGEVTFLPLRSRAGDISLESIVGLI